MDVNFKVDASRVYYITVYYIPYINELTTNGAQALAPPSGEGSPSGVESSSSFMKTFIPLLMHIGC